jgi:hypothetical protein
MPKFIVHVTWESWSEIEVEAESADEAAAKVMDTENQMDEADISNLVLSEKTDSDNFTVTYVETADGETVE